MDALFSPYGDQPIRNDSVDIAISDIEVPEWTPELEELLRTHSQLRLQYLTQALSAQAAAMSTFMQLSQQRQRLDDHRDRVNHQQAELDVTRQMAFQTLRSAQQIDLRLRKMAGVDEDRAALRFRRLRARKLARSSIGGGMMRERRFQFPQPLHAVIEPSD